MAETIDPLGNRTVYAYNNVSRMIGTVSYDALPVSTGLAPQVFETDLPPSTSSMRRYRSSVLLNRTKAGIGWLGRDSPQNRL